MRPMGCEENKIPAFMTTFDARLFNQKLQTSPLMTNFTFLSANQRLFSYTLRFFY